MSTNLQVAKTILEQLGGNKFRVMTGARNFIGNAASLSFRLPSNFANDGINVVTVTLTPADLYTVQFARLRGARFTVVATDEDVYAEDLRALFTRRTGLDTFIGRIIRV